MPEQIKVIIADDHTIFRSGLNMLLSSEPDINVIGEAEDGQSAIQLAKELNPDVILMDIGMPGLNGIEATEQIKLETPDINILVLTMHRSDRNSPRGSDSTSYSRVALSASSSVVVDSPRISSVASAPTAASSRTARKASSVVEPAI